MSEAKALVRKAALEWLAEYTTLEINLADPEAAYVSLPARAQLFVEKYTELLTRKTGVASQSIEGLSQTFASADNSAALIWQLANTLLRKDLKSQVTVFPAVRRW